MSSPEIQALLGKLTAGIDPAVKAEDVPRASATPTTVAGLWELFKKECLTGKEHLLTFMPNDMTQEQRDEFTRFLEHVWYTSATTLLVAVAQIPANAGDSPEEGAILFGRLGKELEEWRQQLLLRVMQKIFGAIRRGQGD